MTPRKAHSNPRLETAAAWCVRMGEGTLAPDELARLQAWLAESAENRRAFEDSVGIWRAVGENSLSPVLVGLRREALFSFETAAQADTRQRWSLPAAWLVASVACIALLVAVAWLGLTLMPTTYATALGEKRLVVLNDGSRISLDAASEVKVRYTERARELRLVAGRAKFDVVRNPYQPFTVTAANKLVRATGTAFSVELLEGQVRVVLYEGRVAVLEKQRGSEPRPVRIAATTSAHSSRSSADTSEIALSPGEELVAANAASLARVISVDTSRSSAWEDGMLSFEREPLAIAVQRMNRYSTEQLSIGDPAAGAIPIDGVFEAGDTQAFVAGVTGVFPVVAHPTASGFSLATRQ